uniref:Ulp1 protease family, C-terminal catalytic domain-containing protein n=1 Tax=Ascaris lumbricoides TaxID=6252 RepID=A0A0M3I1J1_ASCLU
MGNDLIQGLNFYTLWHTGLIIAMAPANLKDGEHHYMLLSMVKADDEPSCIPAPQSWDGIPSLCAPYACTLLGTANSLCIKRLKSIEKGGHYELLQLTNRIDEGTTEETDEQRRINDAYSKNGTYLVNNISYK